MNRNHTIFSDNRNFSNDSLLKNMFQERYFIRQSNFETVLLLSPYILVLTSNIIKVKVVDAVTTSVAATTAVVTF